MILDIHTHKPAPQPQAIISIEPQPGFGPAPRQLYSIGLHPWHSDSAAADTIIEQMEGMARQPWVAAIGEAGIDMTKGAPAFRQMLLLRRQVEIAESIGKPMLLHAVKSTDMIIGMRKDTCATRPWVVHGFRGKPQVAEMYLRAGIMLSFGSRFNAGTLRMMPRTQILAETDDARLDIEDVLAMHAQALEMPIEEYRALISANASRFLSCGC